MDPVIWICIAATFVATALIVTAVMVGGSVYRYHNIKTRSLDIADKNNELQAKLLEVKEKELAIKKKKAEEDRTSYLQYSKDMIEFIRMIIAQTAVLKFKEFCDRHQQFDKVTEANVKTLVSDVAIAVNKSINNSNIMFSDTLFTREFYNHYLVETTTAYVKDLVDKKVAELVVE